MKNREVQSEQVRRQRAAASHCAVSGALTGELAMKDRNRATLLILLIGYAVAVLLMLWIAGGEGPL